MMNYCKKSWCLAAALLIVLPAGRAQVLGGFFNQKATARKYMLEQIALYKIYLGYVKKGYDITRSGIGTIKTIRSGEFNLHETYFSSLDHVNPLIKKQPQVQAVADYCLSTKRTFERTLNVVRGSPHFSSDEKQYVASVAKNMQKHIERISRELEQVIISGRLQLSDDQRLLRMNAALDEAKDAYSFAATFSNDVKLVVRERKRMKSELETTKKIYQLP